MDRKRIYKIKDESVHLFAESSLLDARYVYVHDFGYMNKGSCNENIMCVFQFINIDTLEPAHLFSGFSIMDAVESKEHFDLFMDVNEINNKLIELYGLE